MTMPDPFPPSAPPPRPQGMTGCTVVFLVLIGIGLLLPGLCSLLFIVAGVGRFEGSVVGLVALTFTIGAGGIALIVFAVRNR
jgi:hypothetical protein